MNITKLFLRKPVIIVSLVLSLVLAAFVGVSITGAYASSISSKQTASRPTGALLALKKEAQKATTCNKNAKFSINPCQITETTRGEIAVEFEGQHLIPQIRATDPGYNIYATTLNVACKGTVTFNGQTVFPDYAGRFNTAGTATGCVSGAYIIELQLNQSPWTVYTNTFTIKRP
jgi:hypothetical protein